MSLSFAIITTLGKMIFLLVGCLLSLPIIIWFERRGAAWMQGRVGPNRVGPFGLLQPLADVVKFFFKENFIPTNANRIFYIVAPMLTLVAPFGALSVIPFGSHIIFDGQEISLQIANFNAGVLVALAFTGLEVYPIILAGWGANNKYSTMGALRGASQMVSYEIAMGVTLLSMLMMYGTFDLNEMVSYQEHHIWGVFMNPVATLIFWIAIFAETNRLPFDLPEADAELVAGYHLEYGAMKFALFFMGEYVAMIMTSSLLTTLFFGGYSLLPGFPFIVSSISHLMDWGSVGAQNFKALLQIASFVLKVGFFMFVFVWVRWTLPRFRFDQLMNLGWKILLPISLCNLLFVGVIIYILKL